MKRLLAIGMVIVFSSLVFTGCVILKNLERAGVKVSKECREAKSIDELGKKKCRFAPPQKVGSIGEVELRD